jgi:hypothetical protein
MQTSRVYGDSPVTVELSETREVSRGSQFIVAYWRSHRRPSNKLSAPSAARVA